jgi:hypothetical protein
MSRCSPSGARAGGLLTVLAPLAALTGLLAAQAPPGDSVTLQAGAKYAAGALHRVLFGTDYRSLWTLPIRVQTLNMRTFGGGLTPTTKGGGFQTKSLRFRGGDGFQYGFRSVDKDPAVLPPEFEGTFIEDLVADQTSSQHPFAVSVVPTLLEAAGIPHTDPQLVVLPDDPALGQFREQFAGTLGYIERRAIAEPGRPGFHGALEIIGSDDFFALTTRGPTNLVDARQLLVQRLFDAWIGDWDRHPRQWTFARFSDAPPIIWTPLPEDRDQAFSRYDGFMLWVARLSVPFVLNFGSSYAGPVGVEWNGRELDRRFLTYVPDAAWDSAAAELVGRLTDSAIDAAVRLLPPEAYPIEGARLSATLKRRRDQLPSFTRRLRALVLNPAELHATDVAEIVSITRYRDGRVDVAIAAATQPDVPYVQRTFDPAITHDIRVYLHGGADLVTVRGEGRRTTVRVIGGGETTLADSSSGDPVLFYATGGDRKTGPAPTHVDRRADVGPAPTRPYRYYRDWGSLWAPNGWLAFGPDVGLFVGPGVQYTDFGFRKYPFASRTRFRAGWAFGATTGRADLDVELHGQNSRVRATVYARASGIEVVRYNGLGNETALTGTSEFYRVRQQQYLVIPAVVFPITGHAELGIGPSVEFITTRTGDGRIVDVTQPYGTGEWSQVGGRARLQWDSRDDARYPTRGLFASVNGAVFPPLGDVDSTYGFVEGVASGYLTGASLPLQPTIALRAGGRKLWGAYPFFSSAFIGDAASVRLGRQNRYAGDAAVYGNAELRLRLTDFFVVLPGELGIFGLADAGRVFLRGETSDQWHTAFGGGVWISLLQSTSVLSAAVARSAERTSVYFGTGMAF